MPMAKTNIKEIASTLWKAPTDQNWERFSKALKGSGIVYYKAIFANEGKLSKMQDLAKSSVELYDSKFRPITSVPIFKKEGKRLRGATIYLEGLKVSNLVD